MYYCNLGVVGQVRAEFEIRTFDLRFHRPQVQGSGTALRLFIDYPSTLFGTVVNVLIITLDGSGSIFIHSMANGNLNLGTAQCQLKSNADAVRIAQHGNTVDWCTSALK